MEYLFKAYAYGNFTGEYDVERFSYILEECEEIRNEMILYFPEDEVSADLQFFTVVSSRAFDDSSFDYDSMLVGSRKNPNVDAMWINYVSAMTGNNGMDVQDLISAYGGTENAMPQFTEPFIATEPTENNASGETYIEGYVMYGTGGLNIRNGPGVGYDQIGRLPEGEQVVILETTYSGTAQWGRIERGWVSMDYIQMGTPAVSNVEAGSMYALDYINGTTGNVVSRIGDDYIMSGGFSGSYLFYYGNNPDMKFGFVPYDWTNPKINGTEPISVILLGGNARVNSYLSANMSKAEIDSVVWSIPNVQNVVSEQTYGAMWGNVYMYEIETTSARILYMWYLDDGDNINYPAGEVTISSK